MKQGVISSTKLGGGSFESAFVDIKPPISGDPNADPSQAPITATNSDGQSNLTVTNPDGGGDPGVPPVAKSAAANPKKEEVGLGYDLYTLLKQDPDLSDIEIDIPKDASFQGALSKIIQHVKGLRNVDEEVEKVAESRYGKDVIANAKLLAAGLNPDDKLVVSTYNRYALGTLDLNDENSIRNAVDTIEFMYKETLSGKARDIAIKNIDPESEDFEELFNVAKGYAAEKRDEIFSFINQQVNANKQQRESFSESVKSVIQSGKVLNIEITPQEKKRYLRDIFETTEKVTDPDGSVRQISKYTKNFEEIQKDPAKMAMLYMLVCDGVNLKLPTEHGKQLSGDELEQKFKLGMASQSAFRRQDSGNGQGRPAIIHKEVLRRNY